jgi:hypothetical protein
MKVYLFTLFCLISTSFFAQAGTCDGVSTIKDCLKKLDEVIISQREALNQANANIQTLQNRLDNKGKIVGLQCRGKSYDCLPKECSNLCASHGYRMATLEEVLQYAAKKNNICQWMWVLKTGNVNGEVTSAFPMYYNYPTTACGPANTGDFPRVTGGTSSEIYNTDGQLKLNDGTYTKLANPIDCGCVVE